MAREWRRWGPAKSNRVIARYGPPQGSGAVRANAEAIWVTAHDTHTVWVMKP